MHHLIKETIKIIKRNFVSIILINRFFKNFNRKIFGVNGNRYFSTIPNTLQNSHLNQGKPLQIRLQF